MRISLIYRCCETDTKGPARPKYFSKLNCLNNMLDVFKYNDKPKEVEVKIHAIHDGPCGPLHEQLEWCDVEIEKINVNSNAQSLELSLGFASGLYETDIIYFLEDDYLHTDNALKVLLEGFTIAGAVNKSNIVTLYDHPDRYTRSDDIDRGQTHLFLGNLKYWRTAESTTCTWAIRQDTFIEEKVYEDAVKYGLNDRELFRSLNKRGIILFTPMLGASTHCHLPFMSPFIDWRNCE